MGQYPEFAMQGNYIADVDVEISGDMEQLLPQVRDESLVDLNYLYMHITDAVLLQH